MLGKRTSETEGVDSRARWQDDELGGRLALRIRAMDPSTDPAKDEVHGGIYL